MPQPGRPQELCDLWVARVLKAGSVSGAARSHGASTKTVQCIINDARRRSPDCLPLPSSRGNWATDGFVTTHHGAEYDAKGNLRKEWVRSKRPPGKEFAPRPGHIVKGESALLDADGRIMARWVKTREGDVHGLQDALLATFAAYRGASPLIPAPDACDDELLTIYPLPDLHFGLLAWGKETGADYDTDIATALAVSSLRTLVSRSLPSKHAVLLGLGDYFHQDDQRNATPGSGHQLDVDGRWARVFALGARLATELVEIVASKHETVEVRFLQGNHDINSAMCLTVALSLFYSNNPRIAVNTDPGIAWYRRHGCCLIGATHGHSAKMDRLPMMMAVDRASDWGQSEHRSFFTGHIHTETSREVGGVRVESLQAPAARDAWNAGAGYRSGRSLSAITFHVRDGEAGRHRVNIRNGDQA